MNVEEEEKFHFLKQEKQFIKQAVDAGKKVIGICLGAQLIAASSGSKRPRRVRHQQTQMDRHSAGSSEDRNGIRQSTRLDRAKQEKDSAVPLESPAVPLPPHPGEIHGGDEQQQPNFGR